MAILFPAADFCRFRLQQVGHVMMFGASYDFDDDAMFGYGDWLLVVVNVGIGDTLLLLYHVDRSRFFGVEAVFIGYVD